MSADFASTEIVPIEQINAIKNNERILEKIFFHCFPLLKLVDLISYR